MIKSKGLKFKAILISEDGGKNWLCIRQYYLTDLNDGFFLDEKLSGKRFKLIEGEKENDGLKSNS